VIHLFQDLSDGISSHPLSQPIPFTKLYTTLVDSCLLYIIEGKYLQFLNREIPNWNSDFERHQSDILINLMQHSNNDQEIYRSEFKNKISFLFNLISSYIKHVKDLSDISFHITYKNFNFYNTDYKDLKEICEYINLSILELMLNDSYPYILKLIEIEDRKNSFHSNHPFKNLKVFEAKLAFIRYKWLKRQKYNRNIQKKYYGSNYSEKHLFNNGKVIDLNEKIKIGDEYFLDFKNWIERIEFHYFTEEYTGGHNFGIQIQDAFPLLTSTDSYELFYKIKYYKDVSENIFFFDEVDQKLVKDQTQYSFKKFFYKNYLYFKNNQFSLLVKQNNKYTDEESILIEESYNKLVFLSEKYSNNNFFITFKFLKYKTERIKFILKNNLKTNLTKELKVIGNLILKCENKYKWSANSYNILYQQELKNSVIKIGGISVYFHTSFLLPFSTIEYNLLINKAKDEFTAITKNYQDKKIQSTIDSFKEELKNSEKKTLETITIFTAIISFIVGSIGAYKFLETFIQSVIFILVYSLSISIFVLLIFISTKGKVLLNEYKKHIIIFYSAILLVTATLFLLYHNVISGTSFTPQQEKLIKHHIDSIYQIEKKVNPIK
jgi:hypothetical protein